MAKILLIDDTVFFRRMYALALHDAGHDVFEAGDGLEGIEKAQEAQPDLIILDMAMPKLGGLPTLERLKADQDIKNIKVVVFSALENLIDINRAKRLGAIEYLIKAVDKPADVVQKINHILNNGHSEASAQSADISGFNHTAQSFRVFLHESKGETSDLTSYLQLPEHLSCPKCQEVLALELLPDSELSANTNRHEFKAHLVCPACGDTF